MRNAILLLMFMSPAAVGGQWVEVAPLNDHTNSLTVNTDAVFELDGTRVAWVNTRYKKASREVKNDAGEGTGVFYTEGLDVLEVDCAAGIYRYLTSNREFSNGKFAANIHKSNPDWLPSMAAGDPNGWFVRVCAEGRVHSLKNVRLLFGAVDVKAIGDDYEISALMLIDGERVALSTRESSCLSGFGSLAANAKTEQVSQVLLRGAKTEDAMFGLLCVLGLPRAAFLRDELERRSADQSQAAEQRAAAERRREILLQHLLNQRGTPLPDPTPSRPSSSGKAETVCRYNELSGETRCTTTESP